MKNMNSQIASDSVMVTNKLKNAGSGAESNTKGSLQDGGTQQNMNQDPTGNESVRNMEGPHSEMNSYPPNSGGQNMTGDNFSKMNDNMPGPQMSNYGSGYMRGNFNMTDQQHGGVGNPTAGSDFPQTNSQPYSHQFGQNMRPSNYPPSSNMSRGSPIPGRPGMSGNSLGMLPPNYNPNQQQRPFMSGPSIQQQGGPTPTLNQLLQNPNPSPRYQGGYGDYGMNQQKSGPDSVNNSQSYGPQGWNQQRPVNPYQSQMQGGGQPFGNQGPMFDGNRRHMPSGYPQQQPGQYPNQAPFSPSSQRYPMGQPRLGQPFPQQVCGASYGQHSSQHQGGQSYGPQQQQPPQQQQQHSQVTQNHHHHHHHHHPQAQPGLSSQHSPGGASATHNPPSHHHPHTSPHFPSNFMYQSSGPHPQSQHPSQQQQHQQQQQQASSSSPSSLSSQHSPNPNSVTHPPTGPDKRRGSDDSHRGKASSDSNDSSQTANNQHPQANSSTSQDSVSGTGSSDDLNSDSNSTGTNSRPTPTPTPTLTSTPGPQHPGIPLRPVPSPAGSTGSRSNTPASVTGGNRSGSPMPPRPPSNQLVEGPQGRMQSPMANQQGYPGHQGPSMMPPPMGPNQMGYPNANKMGPNMMGNNPMANYNSQYPGQGQGNYRGVPSMPGYVNQQDSFNGPTSMSNQYNNYGNANMSMNRNMSSMNQYGNQYPPGAGNNMGHMGNTNSQYSNYGPPSTAGGSGSGSGSSSSSGGGGSGSGAVSQSSAVPPSTATGTPNMQGSTTTPSTQSSALPVPCPKGAQAAAHAAMLAAANQSAVKPPYSGSSRSRSPSGSNSSSQPQTPPGQSSHPEPPAQMTPPTPQQPGQSSQGPPASQPPMGPGPMSRQPQHPGQPPHTGQGSHPNQPPSSGQPPHPGHPTHLGLPSNSQHPGQPSHHPGLPSHQSGPGQPLHQSGPGQPLHQSGPGQPLHQSGPGQHQSGPGQPHQAGPGQSHHQPGPGQPHQSGPGHPPHQSGPGHPPHQSGPGQPPHQSGPGQPPHQSGPGQPPHQSGPGQPPHQSGPGQPSHQTGPGQPPIQSGPGQSPHHSGPGQTPHQSGPGQHPHQSGPGPHPHQSGPGPHPHQSGPGQHPHQSGPGQHPHQSGPGQHPHQSGPGPHPHQSGPGQHPHQSGPGPHPHQSGPGQHPHQSGPGQPHHPGQQPHQGRYPHQQQHPGQSPHQQHSGQQPPHPQHMGQAPHPPQHPGMTPHPQQSGPSHLQGQGSGPHPPPHQRMFGPGHYPQQHPMNHVNYNNAMNQMNNQMPPNNSGENSMPHHSNSVDSMGPGSGPPPYGNMGQSGQMGMGSMMNRQPGPSDVTNTHGMSGGCVSVSPHTGQSNMPPNSIPPNSMPPNSMPMNSSNMCDMNNGIPPNAMAPSTSNMGHNAMHGPHPTGPDMGPHGMGQNMGMAQHSGAPNSQSGQPNTSKSMMSSQGDNMSDMDVKPAMTLASTIAGDTSTTVTQSINSPLTNAMENKPTMSHAAPRVMGPPPPRTTLTPGQIDSSSQDSHSSSQDSDGEKVKVKSEIKLENTSHPPTPASQVTPSPATSIHDELENISSPSWPGTPKPEKEKAEKSVFNDTFNKQLDFGNEPDRRMFMERLFLFMDDKGTPITAMPSISKQPIDLYKLYHLVKEKGGMVDVTKNKKWRDVSGALNIGASSSAGFTLRKNYAKFIFPLECKLDRGDADPAPLLASLETPSKKESKKSQQAAAVQQIGPDPFRGAQPPYGNFGGNIRHPQMGNTDMHGPMMPPNVSMMPNNMHYEQGGMMPNSMMPNNNMAMGPNNMGGNSMMPNHSNMANNSMMGNQNMPSGAMPNAVGPQNMMPQGPSHNMIPSSGDSISAQNPFADSPGPGTIASPYQRPNMGQPMPPYSSNMQPPNSSGNASGSFGNFGNRPTPNSMPTPYQSGMNQSSSSFQEGSRMPSSGSSGDSYGSGDNFNQQSQSHSSANSNTQVSSMSGQGSFGSQSSSFSGRIPSGSSGPQSFNQHQQPASHPPTSSAQAGPTPASDRQTTTPEVTRSEPPQAVPQPPPQPTPSKVTPPLLHSTDSNSSTGSQSLRPPSRPASQTNQEQAVPPQPQMYPGGHYSNNQQQAPQQPTSSSQIETFNQPSQPAAPSVPPSSTYSQMNPAPYSGPTQQAYPPGSRPYPQGPQESGYPGYHGQQGPGSGPYPVPKPPQTPQQYGPTGQPYTPTKYGDHRPDGYSMTPGGYSQCPGSYGERSTMSSGQYSMYGAGSCTPRPQADPMQPDMRSSHESWQTSQAQAQRYPSAHPISSHMTSNMPPSPAHMFSRMPPSHQMSPQRPDRRFMPPMSKMQKPGPSMHRSGPLEPKKEIVFPPDSVEATRPHLLKRKKLRHKDIGSVDPWRLMMALKSGLLVESTWALDTLSILLYDDSTVTWFGLQHMPGLIEVLVDHFRRSLVKIFDRDFEELEIGYERRKELKIHHQDESLYEFEDELQELELPECKNVPVKEEGEEGEDGGEDKKEKEEMQVDGEGQDEATETKSKRPRTVTRRRLWKICTSLPDPKKLNEPRNFTLKTRDGKAVKLEENSPDEWTLKKKYWDIYQDFDSSTFDWQLGRGDTTSHIITHMENKESMNFFRKCFYRKKYPNKEEDCKNNNTGDKEIKSETDSADDSTPVIPEDGCKSPSLPILPCEASSPKCEARSQCSDCKDSSPFDTKSSVPLIKSEPANNCDNEDTSVVVKTESSLDMDTKDIKTEKGESEKSDKPGSPDSIQEERANVDEDEDISIITTGRQLINLKRKWTEPDLEGEANQRDETPFIHLPESLEEVSKRCICVSNILRSLSFIPGNDQDLSRHPGLMLVLGRLLLLHHTHPTRNPEQNKFDREVEMESGNVSEEIKREWWWDTLDALRENTLVTLANISGQVNLVTYPEEICMPLLNGLLHWAVCPSAYAQDPLPTMSSHSVLSPHRLVLEALCKLCITENNVDLLLATPPFSRVVQLLGNLVKLIARRDEQVMREFAIVLLSGLVQGENTAARAVALHHPSISLLLDFIESAETQALQIANTHTHGISMLQDNPEMMGTSLDMLRRSATILRALAEVPENRNLFQHHQHRLLHLVMSQILDHRVAAILSDVLFNCAQHS